MKIDMKNKAPTKSRSEKILDILFNHDEFKEEYKRARKDFLLTVKSTNKAGDPIVYSGKVLKRETNRIMNLFPQLPDSWEDAIGDYIKFGRLSPPKSSTKPKIVFEEALPARKSRLFIQIFRHTKKKEYAEAWENIKRIKKLIWEINPKRMSKKDLDVIRQYKLGKKDWEIARDSRYSVSPENARQIVKRKASQLGVTLKTRKR